MNHFKKDAFLASHRRIMIVNRGEIAIRIARSAAELGMTTVAIYTYEDRFSQHRYKTDEAFQIGDPDQAIKPYIDIEAIINLAIREKIDMIHPGYGFLSENYEFALRCQEAGIIFIGPNHDVMRQLGDKILAKQIAKSLDVPVIDGFEVADKLTDSHLQQAKKMGYPLMIKAAGGGGGRGMRLVTEEKQLLDFVREASSEAQKAFGNKLIFIEKYIEQPKHIEVQLLGDKHGNLVHLYERDCSVQRRFQKVVEVAPATSISDKIKQQLYDYALKIGKHLNYSNAGTIEFLVDIHDNPYFIEVNPRIQVEHTVTEEIIGIDIVRSQILIAAGYKLHEYPLDLPSQKAITPHGVALQCRVTTENPKKSFNPDYGVIAAYRNPGGYGLRIDESGVYPGMKISPYFDPMIVKVTARDGDLPAACQKMLRALQEIRIRGVETNIGFLLNVVGNPQFQQGKARVSFIADYPQLLEVQVLQDSATKTLLYLADLMVNGNPDIKAFDKDKQFNTPKLQPLEKFKQIPAGSRDLLLSLGRDKFCQWLKKEKPIHFTDTTFRDAHQSLLATRLRTIDLLKIAPYYAYNLPQLFSMEVWGGATFDVCLRFLKEDPWQRLRLLRQAIPNILFQMLFRGVNGVGYSAYPNNVIEAFIEKSVEEGIDIFRIFDSLNYVPAMEKSIKYLVNNSNSLVEASICYTGDILDKNKSKYNLQYYLDLAKQLEDLGSHMLGIKDMAGLLTPYAAEVLISKLQETVSIPLHLHTHDTSGIQAATYLKAAEVGVDAIDVAIGSMSGLTSQPNFNSIVNMLKFNHRKSDLNINALNEISNYFESVRSYYYPFESDLRAGTAEVYQNEIPGGQYSNLRPQARSLGLEEKFNLIKQNYILANKLLGDIVKVTPSSKVVGDLAMFLTSSNLTLADIHQRGKDISFPDSVINYFKGDLGIPPGGFPEDIKKIVLKDEDSKIEQLQLQDINFDEEFELFKQKFDKDSSLTDFLSFMLYPKVYEEFYNFYQTYGDVYKIPTVSFFYGLKPQELVLVALSYGKEICIEYLHAGPLDDNGMRNVMFRLNGVTRAVQIRDKSAKEHFKANPKADPTNPRQIGSPLQGKITEFYVQKGSRVKLNDDLFAIEAMKMETTVKANRSGRIVAIHQQPGTLVQADDLIITVQ